jgi:hypothetical protein
MTASGGGLGPKTQGRWRRPDSVDRGPNGILWTIDGNTAKPRYAKAEEGLLGDFIDLADASLDKIAEFASRWGTLAPLDPVAVYPGVQRSGREGIDAWHRYAGRVAGLLEIAALIHNGRRPAPHAWDVWDDYEVKTLARGRLQVSSTRQAASGVSVHDSKRMRPQELVSEIITEMLAVDPPRTTLEWADAPVLVVQPQGMLSAVIFQLALSVAKSTRGLTTCASCGKPTPVKRRNGERDFCDGPDCGRRAALRMAQRDRRARVRGSNPPR